MNIIHVHLICFINMQIPDLEGGTHNKSRNVKKTFDPEKSGGGYILKSGCG